MPRHLALAVLGLPVAPRDLGVVRSVAGIEFKAAARAGVAALEPLVEAGIVVDVLWRGVGVRGVFNINNNKCFSGWHGVGVRGVKCVFLGIQYQ